MGAAARQEHADTLKAVHEVLPAPPGEGDPAEPKLGEQRRGTQEGLAAVPPRRRLLTGLSLCKPCSADGCSPGNNPSLQPRAGRRSLCKSWGRHVTPQTQPVSGAQRDVPSLGAWAQSQQSDSRQ